MVSLIPSWSRLQCGVEPGFRSEQAVDALFDACSVRARVLADLASYPADEIRRALALPFKLRKTAGIFAARRCVGLECLKIFKFERVKCFSRSWLGRPISPVCWINVQREWRFLT